MRGSDLSRHGRREMAFDFLAHLDDKGYSIIDPGAIDHEVWIKIPDDALVEYDTLVTDYENGGEE